MKSIKRLTRSSPMRYKVTTQNEDVQINLQTWNTKQYFNLTQIREIKSKILIKPARALMKRDVHVAQASQGNLDFRTWILITFHDRQDKNRR